MFLDIGIGIFVSIFTSFVFDFEISFWLILISVFFAVAPDVDFLYFFPKRGDTKYDHNHRSIIHYPLLYLPAGTILFWMVFGNIWATVFFFSSLFHFIHDSIGIGWGVRWLYPFSNRNYAFFYLYSKKIKKGLRGFIFSFSPKELSKCVSEHGDADWVKNIYYKWHPIAIVELLFFLVALIVLFLYAK